MKWDDFARQLTDVPRGAGKCIFAALHSTEDGSCMGQHPKDGQQVKVNEVQALKKAFRDPAVLFSSGITLKNIKFTFVKVEGDVMLGRTPNLACLVMRTEMVYIVCIYPGDELSKHVFYNCEGVRQRINEGFGVTEKSAKKMR